MRQNPHVRICGGPGSATTLVYPTIARCPVLDAGQRRGPMNRPWARAFLVAQETHGLPLGRGSLYRYTRLIGCGRSR